MGGGEARNDWAVVLVDKSIDKDAGACRSADSLKAALSHYRLYNRLLAHFRTENGLFG